jgi:hypothetical protein
MVSMSSSRNVVIYVLLVAGEPRRYRAAVAAWVTRGCQPGIGPVRLPFSWRAFQIVRTPSERTRIADVVKFNWEAVSADGEVAGVGLAFLVLAPDGRIRLDYQFIES